MARSKPFLNGPAGIPERSKDRSREAEYFVDDHPSLQSGLGWRWQQLLGRELKRKAG